jgi:hypothetical protein
MDDSRTLYIEATLMYNLCKEVLHKSKNVYKSMDYSRTLPHRSHPNVHKMHI